MKCKNTITAARNLAAALTECNTSGFTYIASGKFDQITVQVLGFGAPLLHHFKSRAAQCAFLEERIRNYENN